MTTSHHITKIVFRGLLGSGGYYVAQSYGLMYGRRFVPLKDVVWA